MAMYIDQARPGHDTIGPYARASHFATADDGLVKRKYDIGQGVAIKLGRVFGAHHPQLIGR